MKRGFLKPSYNEPSQGKSESIDREEEHFKLAIDNPYSMQSLSQQRQRLPIFKQRNAILYCLERCSCLVIMGETGCGKSTQIPQYLLESGYADQGRMIGVTQPTRVAVVSLANRIAEERGAVLGHEVGFTVRFNCCVESSHTRLNLMTDGMLLREISSDPTLSKYGVIMVDEVHERTANTDVLLSLLRKVLMHRNDLKIVIASATMDCQLFASYFNLNKTPDKTKDTSVILSVDGRTYPVEVMYCKSPRPDYLKAAVETVMSIHQKEDPGDILVFLTGQDEIEACSEMLLGEAKSVSRQLGRLEITPLYSSLPTKEQLRAFNPAPVGARKVVVATNIAETSLTIPGIVYVVDCGFVKMRALNPRTGIESLVVVPVSKAGASQRAGRAGRLKRGKVYRLYTEAAFKALRKESPPEIVRCQLAPIIAQLMAMGVENILRFHFPTSPPASSMIHGAELLYALGAIDEQGQLTDFGFKMAELPLPPHHAKALLSACEEEFDCVNEMVGILAMLQVDDPFAYPSGQKQEAAAAKRAFMVEEGDFVLLLNVLSSFLANNCNAQWCRDHFLKRAVLLRAVEIRLQLLNILKRFKVDVDPSKRGQINVCRCLVAGFFARAAKLDSTGNYRTVREGVALKIYPKSSVLFLDSFPECVVYNEVLQETIRDVAPVKTEWLTELAAHYYEIGDLPTTHRAGLDWA